MSIHSQETLDNCGAIPGGALKLLSALFLLAVCAWWSYVGWTFAGHYPEHVSFLIASSVATAIIPILCYAARVPELGLIWPYDWLMEEYIPRNVRGYRIAYCCEDNGSICSRIIKPGDDLADGLSPLERQFSGMPNRVFLVFRLSGWLGKSGRAVRSKSTAAGYVEFRVRLRDHRSDSELRLIDTRGERVRVSISTTCKVLGEHHAMNTFFWSHWVWEHAHAELKRSA